MKALILALVLALVPTVAMAAQPKVRVHAGVHHAQVHHGHHHHHRHVRPLYVYPPIYVHPTPFTRPYVYGYNYFPRGTYYPYGPYVGGSYFYYHNGGSGVFLHVR